jgi:hypothetical protein
MMYQYLVTCALSPTTTHTVHARWSINSFSPHCQTAHEQNFRWTVDRTRRPSRLACMILWPQSSGILAAETAEDFGVFSAGYWPSGITVMGRECLSGDSSEMGSFRLSPHLCATRSWKSYCNAWEPPHTVCAVVLTRTLPMSQQVLVSGHNTFNGNSCSLDL